MNCLRKPALVIAIWCFSAVTYAQEIELREAEELVNYAYSAVLGTGYYKVGDQSVYVFTLPFSRTQWKAGDGHQYGFEWLLPVSFGLNDFSWDDPIPDDGEDVGTISFLPGIELHFPLQSGWQLRPYAQYGFARDISNDEWSSVYTGGLKARYDLRQLTFNKMGITWGNRISLAGFNPEFSDSESLGLYSMGLDFRWPQTWRLFDRAAWLGVYVAGNFYFSDADFKDVADDTESIGHEYTIGLSIGGMRDFELLGMEFERMGVGYRFGPNIRAITIFGSFPF
jgi:hypothetical protein